jgi:DNA-binding protein HU-beta
MGKKLSNSDLIAAVALASGKTKKDVKETLKIVEETLVTLVKDGNAVTFGTLGLFKPNTSKERTAKVPGTDRTVLVAAKNGLKFRVSKSTSTTLNGK